MTNRAKKIATWVVPGIVAPLLYFVLMLIWFISMSYHPSHDFEKAKWFSDEEKRYELSGNIIESKMLIGKTKPEVRGLLGDKHNSNESHDWIYDLGHRPGFANIDPDVLDVEFKDGKVIRVGQHET